MDRQRLLVVEDEAAARQLIQTPLGNAGYETLPADNGREALAILEERPCDLIVADTRTPELDGLALLSALKQRSNETATAPVGSVLLIGRTDAALAVQAMRLGALDCILKPFDSSSLVASVALAIERSHEIADTWREDRDSRGLARSEEAETRPIPRRRSARRRSSVPPPANDPRVQAHESGGETLADGDFQIPVKVHFGISNVGTLDAKICRVNAGFIVVSSPSSFALGQRVEVSYRERGIESEVVYSNKQADGSFRLGLAMRDGKHGAFRTEQRVPVHLETVVTTASRNVPVRAIVVDISSSGVGFTTEHPIAVGEMACVDLGAGLVFGEIRHCEKVPVDYRVGLRVEQCLLCSAAREPGKSSLLKSALALFKGEKH